MDSVVKNVVFLVFAVFVTFVTALAAGVAWANTLSGSTLSPVESGLLVTAFVSFYITIIRVRKLVSSITNVVENTATGSD